MPTDYAANARQGQRGRRCCPGYAVGGRGPNELTPGWKALTRAFGVDAHYEARQRQRKAEAAIIR
jgi:hypothetical protein